MPLDPLLLLLGYSVAIGLASFLGGQLSALGVVSHNQRQMVTAFVAGCVIGIALFHLLPHSVEHLSESDHGEHSIVEAMTWVAIGVLAMIVVLRTFDFQSQDASSDSLHQLSESPKTFQSFVGLFIGLSIHSITEGIALGASVRAGHIHPGMLPGLGVFFAIFMHKPLDAYSVLVLLRNYRNDPRLALWINIGFALICPVTAAATYMFTGLLTDFYESQAIGYVLAFACGSFLCIALSELLPEIQFHRHHRWLLVVLVFLGMVVAYGLFLIEEHFLHAIFEDPH